MTIDRNVFFREATLRICGDLRLERAFHATLLYMHKIMPLDYLFAEYFDPGLGAARTIAKADLDGGEELDLFTPIPLEAQSDEHFRGAAVLGQATIFDRPEKNPIAATMLRFHGLDREPVSIMAMRLVEEGKMTGGIVAVTHQRGALTEEHAELMTLLADPFKVAIFNALQHRDLNRLKDRLADDNRFLHRELARISGDEIVGADFGLKAVMTKVSQVAPTESPVLITGETGVGKDVVAKAIHLGSPRREGPFIAVNCGAIPESLLDSELFGHEKGAFTGALARKRGRFERAHQGTIFLDEIGEMPLNAQVRLLRVLQNREIERLGGTKRIPIDIRILAATNKDLEAQVRAGHFREDLWFRLNVFPIPIPPLRERRGDLPALVQHFLERKAKELKLGTTPKLADGELDSLRNYDWPGNVRELENLVERAMIVCRDQPLRFEVGALVRPEKTETSGDENNGKLPTLEEMTTHHIRLALELAENKIHGPDGAGELLGLNPNTLRSKMRRLGIPFRKG